MEKPSLYLAGPITGLSWDQCVGWRKQVTQELGEFIDCFSPLRHKDYLNQVIEIKDVHEEHIMSSQRAIFARDMFDVSRCGGLFVNFLGAKRISIGTVMEIAVGWQLRKPIIVIMEDNNIHQHSMLREASPFLVKTLDDGIDVARRLFLR